MVHSIVYASDRNFNGRLPIMTVREHLCGFYEALDICRNAVERVDSRTGHTVCSGCSKIRTASGLRQCDICDKEYIDKNKFQDPHYETNCPRCVIEYGIDE